MFNATIILGLLLHHHTAHFGAKLVTCEFRLDQLIFIERLKLALKRLQAPLVALKRILHCLTNAHFEKKSPWQWLRRLYYCRSFPISAPASWSAPSCDLDPDLFWCWRVDWLVGILFLWFFFSNIYPFPWTGHGVLSLSDRSNGASWSIDVSWKQSVTIFPFPSNTAGDVILSATFKLF